MQPSLSDIEIKHETRKRLGLSSLITFGITFVISFIIITCMNDSFTYNFMYSLYFGMTCVGNVLFLFTLAKHELGVKQNISSYLSNFHSIKELILCLIEGYLFGYITFSISTTILDFETNVSFGDNEIFEEIPIFVHLLGFGCGGMNAITYLFLDHSYLPLFTETKVLFVFVNN
ncbi:hypothetical protein QTN25_004806 [Entamoeba marina]